MNNYKLKLSSTIGDKYLFDFYFDVLYHTIRLLGQDYPGFRTWYYNKVKEEVGIGGREVILAIVNNYIAGVAVLKKTATEKKICTLRVMDRFQRNGLGRTLISDSFDYLDTEAPLITTSSTRAYQFNRLFDYYGFKKYDELNGYYMQNKNEITYNGFL